VVVGASEGEREFIGVRQIAALVRGLREECDCPIFLNADHPHSLAKAVEAARAGFDAVVFDLSALPFEQNVRQTKEAVETLKAINSAILVEGEIGDIGTGSEIHEEAPDLSRGLTSPVEAKQFVEATGVDILAPAVGNMHGMWCRDKHESAWISRESPRSRMRPECRLPYMADRVPTTKICGRQLPPGSISYTSILNCALPGGVAWRRA
jgi:fructose/tagatose bisphosphate aldolase